MGPLPLVSHERPILPAEPIHVILSRIGKEKGQARFSRPEDLMFDSYIYLPGDEPLQQPLCMICADLWSDSCVLVVVEDTGGLIHLTEEISKVGGGASQGTGCQDEIRET